jgi:hypothetical protein
MKRFAAIGIALMMAAACGSDSPTTPSNNTGPIVFTAQLSAANEVPPIANADANARGSATITFNVSRDPATGGVNGGGTVNFSAPVTAFPAGTQLRAAHIHTGASGIPGGVLIDTGLSAANAITVDANGAATVTFNNINISQGDATNIVANPAGFYFNIHSALNPGGAVRGQLVKQ